MATSKTASFRKAVKQADKILYDLTGTRLKTVVKKGLTAAAEAVSRQVFEDPEETGPLYAVLGVRPDAEDDVVRAAFRALQRKYDPERGTEPDYAKFVQMVAAYRDIMLARGGEEPPPQSGPIDVNE